MEFNFLYMRGRVALSKILSGLGVKKGDIVAIQAFTCTAVPEAIMSIGAIPIYADLEKNSVNMCVNSLEALINSKNVSIVIIQHTFGIPANIDQIIDLCKLNRIKVIEDCCHTLNSEYKGRIIGNFSSASFYSFEWGKPIIAGIGGASSTTDPELLDYLENDYKSMKKPGFITNLKLFIQIVSYRILYRPSLYWFLKDAFHTLGKKGLLKTNFEENINFLGDSVSQDFKFKMPLISKLYLKFTMRKISTELATRERLSRFYEKISSKILTDSIIPVSGSSNSKNVYSRFPLIVENKKKLVKDARKDRVEIATFFDSPVHPLSQNELGHVNYAIGSCPNAEDLCKKLISLPVNSRINESKIEEMMTYISKKVV